MKGGALVDWISRQVWALHAPTFETLVGIVDRHICGVKLSDPEFELAVGAARHQRARTKAPPTYTVKNGVAVIPITGILARLSSQVGGLSQPAGTSTERIRKGLRGALRNEKARSIVFDIDSPGGSIDGIPELAAEIRAAREGDKPIVAYSGGMIASAAYWLAAQADRIVATKSAQVGSIGVVAQLTDRTRLRENAGVRTETIASTRGKAAGASHSITEDVREQVRAMVDGAFGMFLDDVAAGREISQARAEELGDGEIHFAEAALELGLIDEVSGAVGPSAVLGDSAVRRT